MNVPNQSDVKFMLTISVSDKKYDVILNIIKKFSSVYGTYGIHPHEAKNHNQINKEIILNKVNISKKNNWNRRNRSRFLL